MSYLFYDTETTGLVDWKKPSEDPCQPHITQLAALLTDEDGKKLGSMDVLIKPDGWTIPDELANLTGITTEKAEAGGIPIAFARSMFLAMCAQADTRVAHNESFDARIMRISLKRDGLDDVAEEFKAKDSICTMKLSTPILNLPPTAKMLAAGFNKAKAANLGEAYQFFTGKALDGAHNAMIDVMAVKTVFFAIKNRSAEGAKTEECAA